MMESHSRPAQTRDMLLATGREGVDTPAGLRDKLSDPTLDNVEKLTWLSEQDWDTNRLGRFLLTISDYCRGCHSMEISPTCPYHYTFVGGETRTGSVKGRYRCHIHGEWTVSYA